MAMLLKLQEAANYIESPDKEDPSLPRLWTQSLHLTLHIWWVFFVHRNDAVHIQEQKDPSETVVGWLKLSFPPTVG